MKKMQKEKDQTQTKGPLFKMNIYIISEFNKKVKF